MRSTIKKLKQNTAYKIFRLYTRRWSKNHFGQYGEDLFVNQFFKDRDTGIYVDVGCFHPRRYSNTHLLYHRGWHGVNIDMSQNKLKLFDIDRPKDINICAAVTQEPGDITAYSFGYQSAIDTTNKEMAEQWSKTFKKSYKKIKVPARRLSDILEETNIGKVDYINIDVEGAEMGVLNSLDFKKTAPELMSIEIHGRLDDVMSSPVTRFLNEQNYELVCWTPPTVFFARKTKTTT